jgi:hypothetical protein
MNGRALCFLWVALFTMPDGLTAQFAVEVPVKANGNGNVVVPKNSVVLMIAPNKKSVQGFSETMYGSNPLKAVKGVSPVPVVGTGPIGAVKNGHQILAFSGPLGEWDELELSPGDHGDMIMGNDLIVVKDKDGMLHQFRTGWGKWFTHAEILRGDVVKFLQEKGRSSPKDVYKNATVKLDFLDPTKVVELVRSIYQHEIESTRDLSASALTLTENSVQISGEIQVVDEIEAWIKSIDKESLPFASGLRLDPLSPAPAKETRSGWEGFPQNRNRSLASSQKDLKSLQDSQMAEEKTALDLAKSLLAMTEDQRESHENHQKLKECLLRSFRLKQDIQELEIAELKTRLDLLENERKERSKRELDIVAKRMSQLLNGESGSENLETLRKEVAAATIANQRSDNALPSMPKTNEPTASVDDSSKALLNEEGNSNASEKEPLRSDKKIIEAMLGGDGRGGGLGQLMGSASDDKPTWFTMDLPVPFRVVYKDSVLEPASSRNTVIVDGSEKCSIKIDRIVGYHNLEVTIDLEVIPGIEFSQKQVFLVLKESELKSLMERELSGIVYSSSFGRLGVHLGDKDLANDPLNPLNSDGRAIATLTVKGIKKLGDAVPSESELFGIWKRNATRRAEKTQAGSKESSVVDSNVDALLSLSIEPGRWTTTFRGTKTVYAAEYDLESRPQRVTLTKLDEEGKPTNRVQQRLLELREGDLYSAVKAGEAGEGKLDSYDDGAAILETYQRETNTNAIDGSRK